MTQREEFEAWKKLNNALGYGLSRNNAPGSDLDGYQNAYTQGQWQAWQAAQAYGFEGENRMSKQVMQRALDALWVATEHNALHFDENHNTVVQGRSAISELRAEIVKPEVEPVAWVLFRKDEDGLEPVQFCCGKEKPEGEFKDRFELRSVHVSPPDTEAMRRDAERYRWLRDECRDSDIKAGIVWIGQGVGIDAAIDAAINAKESK